MLRICIILILLVSKAPDTYAQMLTAATSIKKSSSADAAAETEVEAASAPVVYHVAEQMPDFMGGAVAFSKFLQTKMKYPEKALLGNVSGKVHVSFVVDEEGRILDPHVVRSLGSGLDEEALRLVRIMPWWTPGRIQGKAVRLACTLPIAFRLLE